MHAPLQPERVSEIRREIFIWIRCNPLKRPDSAKEKQGNPSFFVGGQKRRAAVELWRTYGNGVRARPRALLDSTPVD
jgi:hypothetical protein